MGPAGTPYSGGLYLLAISIPSDYPLTPPSIKFLTKIFHPNVHFDSGDICLDILKKEWSPAWSLQASLRAVLSLMGDPEADSPLNCDAGNMLRAGDILAFESVAKMYNQEAAKPRYPDDKTVFQITFPDLSSPFQQDTSPSGKTSSTSPENIVVNGSKYIKESAIGNRGAASSSRVVPM